MPLVTFLVGHLFYRLQRQPAPLEASGINAGNVLMLLVSLAVSAAFYFALNSGMIALAISRVNHIRFWEVWKGQFLWAAPANFASASAACVILLQLGNISYYAIGLVIPVVIVVYQIYSMRRTLSKNATAG
jgi:phosphatidylserine synthase